TTSTRPPSEASDFTATYLAIRSLNTWATPEQRDRAAKRLAAARDWLAKTPAKDTEDRVFRLLALKAAGGDVGPAVEELTDAQLADGSWPQTDDRAGDAYATGTALFALHEAGSLAADDPVYEHGVEFLL